MGIEHEWDCACIICVGVECVDEDAEQIQALTKERDELKRDLDAQINYNREIVLDSLRVQNENELLRGSLNAAEIHLDLTLADTPEHIPSIRDRAEKLLDTITEMEKEFDKVVEENERIKACIEKAKESAHVTESLALMAAKREDDLERKEFLKTVLSSSRQTLEALE